MSAIVFRRFVLSISVAPGAYRSSQARPPACGRPGGRFAQRCPRKPTPHLVEASGTHRPAAVTNLVARRVWPRANRRPGAAVAESHKPCGLGHPLKTGRMSSVPREPPRPKGISAGLWVRVIIPAMSHVFISYVEEDRALALALSDGLEVAGFTTWYYGRDTVPGLNYLMQTREAIKECRVFLVVLS